MKISQDTIDHIWEIRKGIISRRKPGDIFGFFILVITIFVIVYVSHLDLNTLRSPDSSIPLVFIIAVFVHFLLTLFTFRTMKFKSMKGRKQRAKLEKRNMILQILLEGLTFGIIASGMFLWGIYFLQNEFGSFHRIFYNVMTISILITIGITLSRVPHLMERDKNPNLEKQIKQEKLSRLVVPSVMLIYGLARVFSGETIHIQGVEVNPIFFFAGITGIGVGFVALYMTVYWFARDSILIINKYAGKIEK